MNTISLTDIEQIKAKRFIQKHGNCKRGFSYIATPNSVGIQVHIRCNACAKKRLKRRRAEEDITDYTCW